MSPLSIEPGSPALHARTNITRPRTLTLLGEVNFTNNFFSRDKMPIDRRGHAGVFPGKMCSGRRKNHGCGQNKKEKAVALLYLASGLLPNAEATTKLKSSKANFVT